MMETDRSNACAHARSLLRALSLGNPWALQNRGGGTAERRQQGNEPWSAHGPDPASRSVHVARKPSDFGAHGMHNECHPAPAGPESILLCVSVPGRSDRSVVRETREHLVGQPAGVAGACVPCARAESLSALQFTLRSHLLFWPSGISFQYSSFCDSVFTLDLLDNLCYTVFWCSSSSLLFVETSSL